MRLMTSNDIESYYAYQQEQDRLKDEEEATQLDAEMESYERLRERLDLYNRCYHATH